MILKVFTDGGSKGNPGPSSIGIVMYSGKEKIWAYHADIGIATNNDAEYRALIEALKKIRNSKSEDPNKSKFPSFKEIEKIEFYSDSRLMVNQVRGLFKVKNGKIKEYILQIRAFEQEIGLSLTYTHVPREENSEADTMVNL